MHVQERKPLPTTSACGCPRIRSHVSVLHFLRPEDSSAGHTEPANTEQRQGEAGLFRLARAVVEGGSSGHQSSLVTLVTLVTREVSAEEPLSYAGTPPN